MDIAVINSFELMNPWSNIEVLSDDPEIAALDELEKSLEKIYSNTWKIRDLITGFEVCHFKYKTHIQYIKSAIINLKPNIELKEIGSNHIRKGALAWQRDNTGRSLMGQRYIQAIDCWLNDTKELSDIIENDSDLCLKVSEWLGIKKPQKERLVRLLKARLKWDWKSYEEFRSNDEDNILEYQVCRMDICHYTFPQNMDAIVQAIGQLKPVEGFEGCGSFNWNIKNYAKKEISELNKILDSLSTDTSSDMHKLEKRWLLACLAKTLKEQTKLKTSIHI